MGVLNLSISTGRDTSTLTRDFESAAGKHSLMQRILNFITAIDGGSEKGASSSSAPSVAISVQGNAVQAYGTVTFSAVATAADTVIVNGVTFTAAASAGANQWAVGASATASASGLAAAINASVTSGISGYVTASAALGVCTITAVAYGTSGNFCTLAKGVDSGTVMTVGHVSNGRLSGGAADPTAQTISF